MPHLSPMNWIMMLILMSTILLTMTASLWWKQPQKIQNMKKLNKTMPNNLKWKW